MWMPPLDPAWTGKVEFWELVFGTWTSYAFLVLMWQQLLREPLEEWRYAMICFLGASAFWVNHYFQFAPFYRPLLNTYAVAFVLAYWLVAIRGRARTRGWKLLALLSSIVYTVAFIAFEQLARHGAAQWGMHEFCWMTLSLAGFVALIWWRGHTRVRPRPEPEPYYPRTLWRGAGGAP